MAIYVLPWIGCLLILSPEPSPISESTTIQMAVSQISISDVLLIFSIQPAWREFAFIPLPIGLALARRTLIASKRPGSYCGGTAAKYRLGFKLGFTSEAMR